MIYVKESAGAVVFKLKAVPNAGTSGLAGEYNGMLKVRIAASPDKGKANDELVEFLSGLLKISKSRIEIIKGRTAREKTVQINGIKKEVILKLVEA